MRLDRVLVSGFPPVPVAIGGALSAAALGLIVGQFENDVVRATQALILVVPVVFAAVLGGRRAAYAVAGAATVVFSMLVPPVGSLRVRLTEDLVALVVFSVVAFVIGALVAGRIEILGRVERQRAVLLRSVSHDLRTPLSSIRAAASEILDRDPDPETRTKLLDAVGDEAARLDRLVANLLSLSRIEAGAFVPRRQPVEVAELVEFAAARLGRLFADRPLRVEIPADLPVVHADYVQLDQVVTNLLENAARHSAPGSPVVVGAEAGRGSMTISVADSGPGVDASDAASIFQPFRSGPIAGSSGVGLAICKAIVEAHGGTIAVAANAGGGARFDVTLPLG